MLSNEVKVGITIVVAVIIGFVGFRIMRDIPIFRLGTIIYADYPRVDGLNSGSSITIKGIKIGVVQSMELLTNDSVRVTMNINMIDGIPAGSVAYIRAIDILGTRAIEIERGNSNELIAHLSFIEGVYDEGSLAKIEELGSDLGDNVVRSAESVASLVGQLDSLMREGAKDDIARLLHNLNQASAELKHMLDEKNDDIQLSIENVRDMTQNLKTLTSEESGQLQAILRNLEATSGELSQLTQSIDNSMGTLGEILNKINTGEGTLGKLVNDPGLYNNLDSLSGNLNQLVIDVRENPRHFLKHMKLIEVF